MAEDDQENEFEEPADFGEVTSMESSGKDDHSDAPDTLTDNPAENSEDTDISSIGSWKADAATQDAIRKLDMLFEEPEKQQVTPGYHKRWSSDSIDDNNTIPGRTAAR